MDVETLLTDGFVSFAYPPSLRARVHAAMESWQRFCSLPLEEFEKLFVPY